MNRILAVITVAILLLVSCGKKEKIVEVPVLTDCAPSAPRGLYAINYEGSVEICWVANTESDLAGYAVYRSTSYDGVYYLVDEVEAGECYGGYCCLEIAGTNGTQYYYAVLAYDDGGNESDWTYEEVTATPRPEGLITLQSASSIPLQAGYDLSGLSNTPQAYDLPSTDIYYDASVGVSWLICRRAGVNIQDYGYVSDFYVINYAPTQGWAPSQSAEAIAGHCYIIQSLEGSNFHYAKVYITEVVQGYVSFRWAFQTSPENRDLAPARPKPAGGALGSSGAIDETMTTVLRANEGRQFPPSLEGNADTGLRTTD